MTTAAGPSTDDRATRRGDDGPVPPVMSAEYLTVQGAALTAKVRELVHEGNVRRVVVKNDQGHTVIEIPVTAGVLTAVLAPVLTGVAAIAALANDWQIEVQRADRP